MKKFNMLFISLVVLFLITGCGEKTKLKTVTYDAEAATISLSYPDLDSYKYTEDADELQHPLDVAGIIAEKFSIDIYTSKFYAMTYEEYLDGRYEMYKDTARKFKLAGLDALEILQDTHYSITLSLGGTNYMELRIFDKLYKLENLKTAYKSNEVQDIINSIKIEPK